MTLSTVRSDTDLSPDRLRFTPQPPLRGLSYFRAFSHAGATYALVMPSVLLRATDLFGPFERGSNAFGDVNWLFVRLPLA